MQGQRETNASNTSLIDDIYDDIMLNEVKRKNTYDIKNYSIKLVKEEQEKEPPKEQGIFKNIFSKKENKCVNNGPIVEVYGKRYIQNQKKKKKNKKDPTDIIIQKSDKKPDEKITTIQN